MSQLISQRPRVQTTHQVTNQLQLGKRRKPTSGMLFLHSLQGYVCGTYFLINFLKLFSETASLNDIGITSPTFGPRYEMLSLL